MTDRVLKAAIDLLAAFYDQEHDGEVPPEFIQVVEEEAADRLMAGKKADAQTRCEAVEWEVGKAIARFKKSPSGEGLDPTLQRFARRWGTVL